jgi:hypothetical protein
MVGLLGRVISASQGLYLHRTTQHRKTRTNIHALNGIRTHDPSNQPAKTHSSDRTAAATGGRKFTSGYFFLAFNLSSILRFFFSLYISILKFYLHYSSLFQISITIIIIISDHIFERSKIWFFVPQRLIVGSNPTRVMDVHPHVSVLCCSVSVWNLGRAGAPPPPPRSK